MNDIEKIIEVVNVVTYSNQPNYAMVKKFITIIQNMITNGDDDEKLKMILSDSYQEKLKALNDAIEQGKTITIGMAFEKLLKMLIEKHDLKMLPTLIYNLHNCVRIDPYNSQPII